MQQTKPSFYKKIARNVDSSENTQHKSILDVQFGENYGRLGMQGVAPLDEADGMKEIAMYTPIDYIMEKYGIVKSERDKPISYLYKGIKDEYDIQAIDEYFSAVLGIFDDGEFTEFLSKKDRDVTIKQSPADLELVREQARKQEEEKRDADMIANSDTNSVVAQLMEQNKLLMGMLQNANLLPTTQKDGSQEETSETTSQAVGTESKETTSVIGVDEDGRAGQGEAKEQKASRGGVTKHGGNRNLQGKGRNTVQGVSKVTKAPARAKVATRKNKKEDGGIGS